MVFAQGIVLLTMVLCLHLYMEISPYFETSLVKIKGNNFLSYSEIIKKAGIQPGTNIFRIKLTEIKSRLEKDPWIKKITIRRELPDQIVIELQERKPLMIWIARTEFENKLYLVDQDGMILEEMQDRDETVLDLPVLISNTLIDQDMGMNQVYPEGKKDTVYVQNAIPEIAKILQTDVPLFKQVREVIFSNSGNVTLIPHSGIPEVRMHLRDYQKNLEYFKNLFPQLDIASLEYIDLRFKKRIVIKPNNS